MNPSIFGPRTAPTTRAVTVAPSSCAGVACTRSPSTTRTGASSTSLPSSSPRRSTSSRSPASTLYCLPPVRITAYMARETPGNRWWNRETLVHRPEKGVVEDEATTVARGTRVAERLHQTLRDPLAGHLDQPELGHLERLRAGLVAGQRVPEDPHDLVTVGLDLHVDEVDDDDAADVAQPKLAGDLLGGLEVVAEHRFLEVRLAHVLAGIDVDHGEGFCALDDERPARRQPHLAVERLQELLGDVEA